VKCVHCNHCFMNLFESKWIRCTVNPTAGWEQYYPDLWLGQASHEKKTRKYMARAKGLPQV